MRLRSQCYLPEPPRQPADTLLGLPDLRKGLNRILLGYLLSAGAILAAGAVVWRLIVEVESAGHSRKMLAHASTVIFGVALFLGLMGSTSLTLIVRGKWICLASAPEQHHAKWMMFLSILCIIAGPFLNIGVYFIGDSDPEHPNRAGKTPSLVQIQKEFEAYKHGMPKLDTRASIRLAGKVIGLFSGVFFVLFLRGVALCWSAPIRARITELYLLFVALLAFGVFVLIRNPGFMLARPLLLLGLGAGWLVAGLWYFGLIVSMSVGASILLARRSR